ncbi:MAG TPA: hypothetical protein ENH91_04640 [Leeuwenhoekiella sp.]|nr:hypothetical protein [Leeuwenhoekiella sp.]
MKIILLLINLLIAQLLSAQAYDNNMQKALATWHEGNAVEASAQFEKIASSSSEKWLPNYYVGLVNATEAFRTEDYEKADAMLKKAQHAIDSELEKMPENAELMVVQALIYTAYITKDPMMNGQQYAPKINAIYAKAKAIAPENPRVVIEKAQFELESAKYTGDDTQASCEDLQSAKQLFDTFKNDEAFYPSWGKEQLDQAMANCK